MAKNAVAEKSQNTEIVENFLKAFCAWMDKSKAAPKESDLDKYLSKNFQIKRNEHFQAKSLNDYLARINKLRETYSSCLIPDPSNLISTDNKIAVRFEATFAETEGTKTTYLISAFATVENGKIAFWEEISHEKA